ncbi:MAG: methyltransferase domain-containing protein [Gammaproteobacteria bacterium]|nr:methyltransferase domain-containing protein [Gammaproteobacteria bacterium]
MTESRRVVSNQDGPHERVQKVVRHHLDTEWRRPIASHSREAFDLADRWLRDKDAREVVLDSGCGTGESTRQLAAQFPDAAVIGVDRSAHRLGKLVGNVPSDGLCLRAEVGDFWRLAVLAQWQVTHHFILYPNPYPKAAQLRKRWHGSPAFPALLAVGGRLEVRTNWRIYAHEFVMALEEAGRRATMTEVDADGLALSPLNGNIGKALSRCSR